jgi:hypothetical protein
MWELAWRRVPTRWPGSEPTRGAFGPSIVKTGRPTLVRATRSYSEGVADWKGIFQAAESVGGVEYYLVEQEGSQFSEFETVHKCLQAFRATPEGL